MPIKLFPLSREYRIGYSDIIHFLLTDVNGCANIILLKQQRSDVNGRKKKLQIYDCDYVMNTQMVQTPYIIENMIYQGLYILAGAPKVGKSWFALELCLSVAEGRQFLKHETNCGQALYLSLEDSLLRLQNRLYEFTDETIDNLSFAIMAESIGNGLEEQIENTKQSLPNLKIQLRYLMKSYPRVRFQM